MTAAASGHSFEILESKAELQFVLNNPSDLLLKPILGTLIHAVFQKVISCQIEDNFQLSYRLH